MPLVRPEFDAAADDQALMRGIAGGDQSALSALYDRFSPLLLGLCVRILNDRADAEDVLVDVFFELWRRAERYDPARGSPLSYLTTLARSRSLDRRRGRGRQDPAPWEAAAGGEAQLTDKNGQRRSAPPSPLTDAMGKERHQRIRRAMGALTAPQRRAVELSFFEGLSHREIADKAGLPLGTVKSHIRLGLIQLRDLLRTEYDSDENPNPTAHRAQGAP